jgi:Zn-dependent peptidase ImmA (M78 family)
MASTQAEVRIPTVNPDNLVWARKTAGLSEEEACQKLSITDAHGLTKIERLEELEKGSAQPTRAMLLKMAQHYRRPLITFYLSSVPPKGDRGNDYRTLPESVDASENALVDALVRDIKARQALVRAILEDDEDFSPLSFVGSATPSSSVEELTQKLRKLGDFTSTSAAGTRTSTDSFGELRKKVEGLGVFVLLAGDLGSHHSAISVDAFRGFALADKYAPFIVINDQDARTAWSFTLLHELTHILLGETGISNDSKEGRIEKICNDVASEILLPRAELGRIGITRSMSVDELMPRITGFASQRNLSSSMVAYRLLRAGTINAETWRAVSRSLREMWLSSKTRKKELARAKEGGPNYYIVKRHRLGPALLRFVQRSLESGELTPSTAGRVLGVRSRNVAPLLQVDAA